jgi:hypothetical protein
MPYRPGMTFEPRSMVLRSTEFGSTQGLIRPAEGVAPQDHRYRAAMIQHILARYVNQGVRSRGLSMTTFIASVGDIPGMTADRQRRIMRGETAATFGDFAFWVAEFPKAAVEISKYFEHWEKSTQ